MKKMLIFKNCQESMIFFWGGEQKQKMKSVTVQPYPKIQKINGLFSYKTSPWPAFPQHLVLDRGEII